MPVSSERATNRPSLLPGTLPKVAAGSNARRLSMCGKPTSGMPSSRTRRIANWSSGEPAVA
jgi:hypothetical protein